MLTGVREGPVRIERKIETVPFTGIRDFFYGVAMELLLPFICSRAYRVNLPAALRDSNKSAVKLDHSGAGSAFVLRRLGDRGNMWMVL